MSACNSVPQAWRRQGLIGFTIIELMITLGIIALVAVIAVPYFVAYRKSAQTNVCVSNLRVIDYAKEQWALQTKGSPTAPCSMEDIRDFVKGDPQCPASKDPYNVTSVDTRPECPTGLPAHVLP